MSSEERELAKCTYKPKINVKNSVHSSSEKQGKGARTLSDFKAKASWNIQSNPKKAQIKNLSFGTMISVGYGL